MGWRADFNMVPLNSTLNERNPSTTGSFEVSSQVAPDDACIFIQIASVGITSHSIRVNDRELPGEDLPGAPGGSHAWLTWMKPVPKGYLKGGSNKLSVIRRGRDDFNVGTAFVFWREKD